MSYTNQYSGFGSYPYPNYTRDFSQSYGQPQYQPNNQQSNGLYFYVNGVEGAKAFMVSPNSQAILFDSDSNKFFIKTANAQGQATMKEFEYAECNPTPQPKQADYVTKEEFNSFKQDVLNKITKEEPNNVQSDAVN